MDMFTYDIAISKFSHALLALPRPSPLLTISLIVSLCYNLLLYDIAYKLVQIHLVLVSEPVVPTTGDVYYLGLARSTLVTL